MDKIEYIRDTFEKQHVTNMEHVFDHNLNKTDWEDYELDYKKLMEWVILSGTNTYSYLDRSLNSAEQLSGFLCLLRHALIDDGEVCFFLTDGHVIHPKMLFMHRPSIEYVNENIITPFGRGAGLFDEDNEGIKWWFTHDVDEFIRGVADYEEYYLELHRKNEIEMAKYRGDDK